MRIWFLLVVLLSVSCKKEKSQNSAETKPSETEIENFMEVPLEIYDFDGLEPFLSTATDSTYVVNFWATWCAPCIKELPYLEALHTAYNDKKVDVLLVSLDFPKKYDSHLKPFIAENKLKSKVVALDDPDSNRWIRAVDSSWSGAIPATLIFNKDKRQFYEKSFTYEELETELKQFIN